MSEKKRAVSLIRPNGGMHVGQYFGSVNRFVAFQETHECFFGVADLHQITLPHLTRERRQLPGKPLGGGPERRRTLWEHAVRAAVELRACGVDPERSFLFVQSLVPEHVELAWILGTFCRHQELLTIENFDEARNEQEDREEDTGREELLVSASFLSYPVLQAADILAYRAHVVPARKDQESHVKLAAGIANQLNGRFPGLFPQPHLDAAGAVTVMGLVEPRRPMARRHGDANFIGIFEDEGEIRRKIEAAVVATSPDASHHSPGVENLLSLLEASAPGQAQSFREDHDQGRLDVRELKAAVVVALSAVTAELRERRIDPAETAELVRESSARLRARAAETLLRVKAKLGLPTGRPPLDGNWWQFANEREVRRDREKSRLTGFRAVNPDGRISYGGYLGLDALLACQTPTSRVPDERVFIVAHQMIELAFKLLVFDLGVVARTLEHLARLAGDEGSEEKRGELRRLVEAQGTEARYGREKRKERYEKGKNLISAEDEFWLPVLTASSRIEFTCREHLPTLMRYLSDERNFNAVEFYYFRSNLNPASGFQSAQYRLIQKALGKGNLLSLRLFPGEAYRAASDARGEGPISVIDQVVLGESAATASPSGAPLDSVARLDKTVHDVLAGVALLGEEENQVPPVDEIDQQQIEEVVQGYRSLLRSFRQSQRRAGDVPEEGAEEADGQALAAFHESFRMAAEKENEWRRGQELAQARRGAYALQFFFPPGSNLKKVLDRLVEADDALHKHGDESFLQMHRKLADERIEEVQKLAQYLGDSPAPGGTGGGGVPYLAFISQTLVGLFPALVAMRGLEPAHQEPVWQDL